MIVLVVDDSIAIRVLVTALIQDMGHTVIQAGSGQEAIELFLKHPVELVLMDVEMPGIGGFEATRKIRKISDRDWVPIIFLSGHSADEDIVAGIDAGGDAYLAKPVNGAVLQAMVRAMNRIGSSQKALTKANRELSRLARIDGLTGLPNRRTFDETFDREWAMSRRRKDSLSLLMVDVDQFKLYNDTFGHGQGDVCLREIANAMAKSVRRPADLPARYGGEEFVLLLPETDEAGALDVGERVLKKVEGLQIPHADQAIYPVVTVSVGIATRKPEGDISKRLLFKRADEALYDAKEQGRNRLVTGF